MLLQPSQSGGQSCDAKAAPNVGSATCGADRTQSAVLGEPNASATCSRHAPARLLLFIVLSKEIKQTLAHDHAWTIRGHVHFDLPAHVDDSVRIGGFEHVAILSDDRGIPIDPLGIAIYFNVPAIIVLVLCLGLLVGAFNGLLITRFNVAPFIATLGTLYVARGTAQLSNSGATFPNLVGNPELGNTGFPILGEGNVLGIPIVIWIMVLFAVIAAFVAGKMPFGRQVYAVGGNERAAELSGIYVNRIKMAVYMICGMCAAMTGLVTASQLVAAHPAIGESYELNAIAAVVLGGTSLSGGRGSIWGTIIGALVIGVLANGLVLLGVQEFWKKVITGLVIILAVVLDQLQARLQERLALQRP